MRIKLYRSYIDIIKETDDMRYPNTVAGESQFLYHLKNKLNSMGFQFIKKRMCKDGHLVDDLKQYLRAKNGKHTMGIYCIYDDMWAIRFTTDGWNKDGKVTLRVEQYDSEE